MSLLKRFRFATGLRQRLHFAKLLLRHHQWRSLGVFLWDSVKVLVPKWASRNWAILLLAVAFLAAELFVVARTVPLRELATLSSEGETNVRLGIARLYTAVLTFLLALSGTCIAIFEIRRALARPRLSLTLQGVLPRLEKVFVPQPPSTPGQPWRCCDADIRVWNLSDVMAHHFTVRLLFEQPSPFQVKVREGPGIPGRAWQLRHDLPGIQWEFRSEDPVKLYGQDVLVIGHIQMSLPAEVVQTLEQRPAASFDVWVRAFVRDEWSGREQTLLITLEQARTDAAQ
jgi:hypothetical protein